MIVDLCLPNQCARRCIHGISTAAHVAKKCRKLVRAGDRTNADRGSDHRLCCERPAGASALCIKRVDPAITTSYKQQTTNDGRLSISRRCVGKSERPFQLQPGHLFWRQSGHHCWLKPAVVDVCAPAVPLRSVELLEKLIRTLRALGNVGRGTRDLLLRGCRERQNCDDSN